MHSDTELNPYVYHLAHINPKELKCDADEILHLEQCWQKNAVIGDCTVSGQLTDCGSNRILLEDDGLYKALHLTKPLDHLFEPLQALRGQNAQLCVNKSGKIDIEKNPKGNHGYDKNNLIRLSNGTLDGDYATQPQLFSKSTMITPLSATPKPPRPLEKAFSMFSPRKVSTPTNQTLLIEVGTLQLLAQGGLPSDELSQRYLIGFPEPFTNETKKALESYTPGTLLIVKPASLQVGLVQQNFSKAVGQQAAGSKPKPGSFQQGLTSMVIPENEQEQAQRPFERTKLSADKIIGMLEQQLEQQGKNAQQSPLGWEVNGEDFSVKECEKPSDDQGKGNNGYIRIGGFNAEGTGENACVVQLRVDGNYNVFPISQIPPNHQHACVSAAANNSTVKMPLRSDGRGLVIDPWRTLLDRGTLPLTSIERDENSSHIGCKVKGKGTVWIPSEKVTVNLPSTSTYKICRYDPGSDKERVVIESNDRERNLGPKLIAQGELTQDMETLGVRLPFSAEVAVRNETGEAMKRQEVWRDVTGLNDCALAAIVNADPRLQEAHGKRETSPQVWAQSLRTLAGQLARTRGQERLGRITEAGIDSEHLGRLMQLRGIGFIDPVNVLEKMEEQNQDPAPNNILQYAREQDHSALIVTANAPVYIGKHTIFPNHYVLLRHGKNPNTWELCDPMYPKSISVTTEQVAKGVTRGDFQGAEIALVSNSGLSTEAPELDSTLDHEFLKQNKASASITQVSFPKQSLDKMGGMSTATEFLTSFLDEKSLPELNPLLNQKLSQELQSLLNQKSSQELKSLLKLTSSLNLKSLPELKLLLDMKPQQLEPLLQAQQQLKPLLQAQQQLKPLLQAQQQLESTLAVEQSMFDAAMEESRRDAAMEESMFDAAREESMFDAAMEESRRDAAMNQSMRNSFINKGPEAGTLSSVTQEETMELPPATPASPHRREQNTSSAKRALSPGASSDSALQHKRPRLSTEGSSPRPSSPERTQDSSGNSR